MSVLKLKCVDQVLTILTTPLITSGAKEVNEVSCEFDSTWNNFGKTAVFYREETKAYHVVMVNNICKIPQEVLIDDGTLYLGLFGVNGNQRKTTNLLRYKVVKGAIVDGIVPQEPTPQIYEQILSVYGQVVAKYESIFTDINKVVADAVLQGVVNQNNPNQLCKFWYGTKAEYDLITTKESNTIYYVLDDNTSVFYNKKSDGSIELEDVNGNVIEPKVKIGNIVDSYGNPYNPTILSLKHTIVNFINGKGTTSIKIDNPLYIKILESNNDGGEVTTHIIKNFRTKYFSNGLTEKTEITILDTTFVTLNKRMHLYYLE